MDNNNYEDYLKSYSASSLVANIYGGLIVIGIIFFLSFFLSVIFLIFVPVIIILIAIKIIYEKSDEKNWQVSKGLFKVISKDKKNIILESMEDGSRINQQNTILYKNIVVGDEIDAIYRFKNINSDIKIYDLFRIENIKNSYNKKT